MSPPNQDAEQIDSSSERESQIDVDSPPKTTIQSNVDENGDGHPGSSRSEQREKSSSSRENVSESSSDHIPIRPGKRFLLNQNKPVETQSLKGAAIQPPADTRAQSERQPSSLRERLLDFVPRPLRRAWSPEASMDPSKADDTNKDPGSPSTRKRTGETGNITGDGNDASNTVQQIPAGGTHLNTDGSGFDRDDTRAPTGDGTLGSQFANEEEESDEVFESTDEQNGRITSPFQSPSGFQFDKTLNDFPRVPRRETIFGVSNIRDNRDPTLNETSGQLSCRSEPMAALHTEAVKKAKRRPSFRSEPRPSDETHPLVAGNFQIWSDRTDRSPPISPILVRPPDVHRTPSTRSTLGTAGRRSGESPDRNSNDERSSQPSYDVTGELYAEGKRKEKGDSHGNGRDFDDMHRHPPLPPRRTREPRPNRTETGNHEGEMEEVGRERDTSWVTATGRFTQTPRPHTRQVPERTEGRDNTVPMADWLNAKGGMKDSVKRAMQQTHTRVSMADGCVNQGVQSAYDRMRRVCEESLGQLDGSLLSYEKRLHDSEKELRKQSRNARELATRVANETDEAIQHLGKAGGVFHSELKRTVKSGTTEILKTIAKVGNSEENLGRELESARLSLKDLMEYSMLAQEGNLKKVRGMSATHLRTGKTLRGQQTEFEQRQLGLTTNLTQNIRKITRRVQSIPRGASTSPPPRRTARAKEREPPREPCRKQRPTILTATSQPQVAKTVQWADTGLKVVEGRGEKGSEGVGNVPATEPSPQRNSLPPFLEKTLVVFDGTNARDFSDYYRYFSQMIDGPGEMKDDVKLYWLGNYLRGQARDAYELCKLDMDEFKLPNLVKYLSRMFDRSPSTSNSHIIHCVQGPHEDFRNYSVRLRNEVDKCRDARYDRPSARAAATLAQLKNGVLTQYVTAPLMNATTIFQAIEAYEMEKKVQDIRELKRRRTEARVETPRVETPRAETRVEVPVKVQVEVPEESPAEASEEAHREQETNTLPLSDGMRRRDHNYHKHHKERRRRYDEEVTVNSAITQGKPPDRNPYANQERHTPIPGGLEQKTDKNCEFWCDYHRAPGHKTSECYVLLARNREKGPPNKSPGNPGGVNKSPTPAGKPGQEFRTPNSRVLPGLYKLDEWGKKVRDYDKYPYRPCRVLWTTPAQPDHKSPWTGNQTKPIEGTTRIHAV